MVDALSNTIPLGTSEQHGGSGDTLGTGSAPEVTPLAADVVIIVAIAISAGRGIGHEGVKYGTGV